MHWEFINLISIIYTHLNRLTFREYMCLSMSLVCVFFCVYIWHSIDGVRGLLKPFDFLKWQSFFFCILTEVNIANKKQHVQQRWTAKKRKLSNKKKVPDAENRIHRSKANIKFVIARAPNKYTFLHTHMQTLIQWAS